MDFLIASPPYNPKFAGVVVLHQLCNTLNEMGYKAGIIFMHSGSQDTGYQFSFSADPRFIKTDRLYYDFFSDRSVDEINRLIHNSIIIYPDVVKGNPLAGRSFATYVLGRPSYQVESKFIISYSCIFHENPNKVLFLPIVSPHFNNINCMHWSARALSFTYFGKGKDHPDFYLIPGTVEITREWPENQFQLSLLLRHCKYFFSWDLSSTNLDALMCGCLPVLLGNKYYSNDILLSNTELGKLPQLTLDEIGDLRSSPKNISDIDDALNLVKVNVDKYINNWPSNVRMLAEELIDFSSTSM